MKRILLISMLLAVVALTSCDRLRGTRTSGETSNITFNLSSPTLKQTKTTTITRYILEVYKASDPATVVKRVEQAAGTIVTSLENNTNYVCLFWADGVALNDNTNGTYNATNLKNVTLNTGKEMTEAFFGRLDITDATTTFNITLTRPTAQVNLVATDILLANTDLVVTFNQNNAFNTFSSEVLGTAASTSKTFNSTKTTGTLGTLLTFASVVGIVSDFTAVHNSLITNPIPTVPLKANYITNIRGPYGLGAQDFTLVIVVDDVWETEVEGVEINVGTSESPNWIKVADRNAEKGGTNGATAGNTFTDYGYHYQWSDANNDPSNADKAHKACFDLGKGAGTWRLPTQTEWLAIMGNVGINHDVNANRKLKWEDSTWKLYDERAGNTSNFVYFPLSGLYSVASSDLANQDSFGYYWSGTPEGTKSWYTRLTYTGFSTTFEGDRMSKLSVRCVKNV